MVRVFDINSLAAAVLLKQAIKEAALALVFDFGDGRADPLVEFCQNINLETYTLDRKKEYQRELFSLKHHSQLKVRKFYQRFIAYHLITVAESMDAGVLDTLDKSERLLEERSEGFYGHLMPFYSLYKSEVFDLAHFLNISDQFMAPTGYLGNPWDKMDPILYLLTEKQVSPEEISNQYQIDLSLVKKINSKINKELFKIPVSQLII